MKFRFMIESLKGEIYTGEREIEDVKFLPIPEKKDWFLTDGLIQGAKVGIHRKEIIRLMENENHLLKMVELPIEGNTTYFKVK